MVSRTNEMNILRPKLLDRSYYYQVGRALGLACSIALPPGCYEITRRLRSMEIECTIER